jgi:hypothetical protein
MKKAIYIVILFAFFKLLLKEAILKPISKRTIKQEGWAKSKSEITGFIIMKMEIKKEGHYQANKNANGGFFDQIRTLVKKSEFENDQLNGFSLFTKNKLEPGGG